MQATRRWLCAVALSALASVAPSAQNDTELLGRLNAELDKALDTADRATLLRLLHQDFSWTDTEGRTRGKEEFLSSVTSASAPRRSDVDLEPRDYHTLLMLRGTRHESDSTVRFVRIWVKVNDRWQTLVHQETLALDNPPAPPPRGERREIHVPEWTGSTEEKEVVDVFRALEHAQVQQEAVTYDRHTGDAYVAVPFRGGPPTFKPESLASLRRGTGGPAQPPGDVQTMKARVFGDAALLTADLVLFHFTRVFVRSAGIWQQVFLQQTKIN